MVWSGLASPSGAVPADKPGELIVKLRKGVPSARGRALIKSQGGSPAGEIPQLRLQRLRVPEKARLALQQNMSRFHEVEWVEPNALLPPAMVPNDPEYPQSWHLPAIAAPDAWDLTTGTPAIVVAILDSGVDPGHPDLAAKLVPGHNFYDGNADTSDVFGHGTKVAGAAAAATGNGLGVASIGWQTSIMPIRVTGTDGWASAWAIAQGLTHAVDHGARVMNLSFGGLGGSSTVVNAAEYVAANGGVVVVSSGNCGCVEAIPPSEALLTVGATDQNDALISGSSRGDHVDLTAPGAAIPTTVRGGGYSSGTGTSYSAPVVSGLIALMLAADSALTAPEVEDLLASTALDLGSPGWDPSFGKGRVDAYEAVLAAAGGEPPAPACSDGLDNDGDGTVDLEDFGCDSPGDLSERTAPGVIGCDDGVDGDGDGLIDFPDDPGCAHPLMTAENPPCNDGLDNDDDSGIDFDGGLSALGYFAGEPDPECDLPYRLTEKAQLPTSCGLGVELALLLPPLIWLHERRRRRS
jgi:subtilisin family serine protease